MCGPPYDRAAIERLSNQQRVQHRVADILRQDNTDVDRCAHFHLWTRLVHDLALMEHSLARVISLEVDQMDR